MAAQKKTQAGLVLGGIIFIGVVVLVMKPGTLHASRVFLGWAGHDVRRGMSLEQDPAETANSGYYAATAKGPVALADVVRDFRGAWRDQGVEMIHAAACEVATGLLHHGDVEVGEFDGKQFVPWTLSPWAAAERISAEVMPMNDFLQDGRRYVFRRK